MTISPTGAFFRIDGGPFVTMVFSNHDHVMIRLIGFSSQVEGEAINSRIESSKRYAPMWGEEMKAGMSITNSFGQPLSGTRWRIAFTYTRIDWMYRLRQYLFQHKETFPISSFKISQPKMVLHTNYSEWVPMREVIRTN